MTRIFLYPYGPSNSARAIVDEVEGWLIKRVNSKYVQKPKDLVINWGSKDAPFINCLNRPSAVTIARSKLATFRKLRDWKVPTLEFTCNQDEAEHWGRDSRIFGRDLDNGQGGSGITVYESGDLIGHHLFYTRYFRKQREFRVHVYRDRVICTSEKKRINGHENIHKYIRSHKRGWVFAFNCLKDNPVPPEVEATAIRAIEALGLDFGGVDVGWHDKNGVVIFEVNTAPGLEATTLKKYGELFTTLVKGL